MHIPVVVEVLPFFFGSLAVFGLLGLVCKRFQWKWTARTFFLLGVIAACYMLYFFRDPDRQPPVKDVTAIVAGADGTVAAITALRENKYLHTDCISISIFLSLFDVHVNRAPFAGKSRYLGYFPGKHFFTFQEKSSDVNQHNKIFIEGQYTRCLITQIVGPVCRRVVYWPDHDRAVDLTMGEKIGMMKFGSRLDMYLPKSDIMVEIRQGARVRAGETVIGHATADKLNQKEKT